MSGFTLFVAAHAVVVGVIIFRGVFARVIGV